MLDSLVLPRNPFDMLKGELDHHYQEQHPLPSNKTINKRVKKTSNGHLSVNKKMKAFNFHHQRTTQTLGFL